MSICNECVTVKEHHEIVTNMTNGPIRRNAKLTTYGSTNEKKRRECGSIFNF